MMRVNLLESLSDNIVVDKNKCVFCSKCVETCILDNLRMKLAPCRKGCPLGTNVQGYILEVFRGNDDRARDILRESLIFPEILGRICPAPCEDNCHRGTTGDGAVAARAIKRYLIDGQTVADIPIPVIAGPTQKKIAIIGSGPAGLQAAHDIRLAGHEVHIFDAEEKPGGMLRWAIPEYRLPVAVLDRELALIQKIGVHITLGYSVDENSLKRMRSEYDAVIVAIGCQTSVKLGIKGEVMDSVFYGLDLLRSAKYGTGPKLRGRAIVIGGGNVAIDAALTALRLGAAMVTIVSLENEDELPASAEEIKIARNAGIEFEHSWGPIGFHSEDDRLSRVDFQRCLAVFDSKGRFEPRFDECALKSLSAETIIVAIGQTQDGSLFSSLGEIDPLTLQAGDSNVFIAGDCRTGSSSVVNAMAEGRRAAESVNRLLEGEHLRYGRSYPGPVETEFEIDTTVGSDTPRAHIPQEVSAKLHDFSETERCLDKTVVLAEAGRCHSCGAPFGKYRTCWFCLPCEVECPHDALWVEIPYLLR